LLKPLHLKLRVTNVRGPGFYPYLHDNKNQSESDSRRDRRRVVVPWIIICLEMKREQLARRLAKESGITPAAAADQLDHILNDILKRVRRGQSASLPGLGTFWPGPKPEFYFEQGLPPGARRTKAGAQRFKKRTGAR
jgi:hypothetical protein